MSTRIPSSLVWLIDKRARLDAELKKTQASLDKAQKLIQELQELRDSLAAVDKTLQLHEISVDVSLIDPKRSHYKRIDLPHGELTRSILMCLGMNQGAPVPKNVIVDFVIARNPNLPPGKTGRSILSRPVHDRLQTLYRQGVVQKHHPNSSFHVSWSLHEQAKNGEAAIPGLFDT